MDVGSSADQYTAKRLELVKASCLSVALALGDDITQNETVIVGGLLPALLYGGRDDPLLGAHVGTNDLDLALDLVILENARYEEVRKLLLRAGFKPDVTEHAALVRQRWRHAYTETTIDFLMPLGPDDDSKGAGKLQHLTSDLAATKMLGLDLALRFKIMVAMEGQDLKGRRVKRDIPLCPPHIFVMLKALAMKGRDKEKDAYDLYYVLRQIKGGPAGVAEMLGDLRDDFSIRRAIMSLRQDFETIDGRGPRDVCAFLGAIGDVVIAADALANVQELLRHL